MKNVKYFIMLIVFSTLFGSCGGIQTPPTPPECEGSFVWEYYWETRTPAILIRGGLILWTNKHPEYRQDVFDGVTILKNSFEDVSLAANRLGEILMVKVNWLNGHLAEGEAAFHVGSEILAMFDPEIPLHPCDREWAVQECQKILDNI